MTEENIDWRRIWDDLNGDDEHQQAVMQERLNITFTPTQNKFVTPEAERLLDDFGEFNRNLNKTT